MGTVKEIQFFSTVLVTGDNKEVTIPNSQIQGNNLVNYTRLGRLRVDFVFGVSYADDLRKVKEVLHEILTADPRVLADPAPNIFVQSLDDSSVNIAAGRGSSPTIIGACNGTYRSGSSCASTPRASPSRFRSATNIYLDAAQARSWGFDLHKNGLGVSKLVSDRPAECVYTCERGRHRIRRWLSKCTCCERPERSPQQSRRRSRRFASDNAAARHSTTSREITRPLRSGAPLELIVRRRGRLRLAAARARRASRPCWLRLPRNCMEPNDPDPSNDRFQPLSAASAIASSRRRGRFGFERQRLLDANQCFAVKALDQRLHIQRVTVQAPAKTGRD